ncbi:uncharacterized protein SCHCODRAFT_02619989 [Schizophyllum commune H4-8]|uniref:uncharacterized protein n=1 Tax=Schizophyllum commune (strain H4-8 / FGSC 9210) TaxID=578458 RepID=UPI00215E7CDC|nr:uncharacterized protein SCHCODRAFT_02619989 [Schizophyllum commune H4-8]KAI5895644.1 hypothetical protein SCHCODRAFT_02619989 [Schizophyllum commune H4-8]
MYECNATCSVPQLPPELDVLMSCSSFRGAEMHSVGYILQKQSSIDSIEISLYIPYRRTGGRSAYICTPRPS